MPKSQKPRVKKVQRRPGKPQQHDIKYALVPHLHLDVLAGCGASEEAIHAVRWRILWAIGMYTLHFLASPGVREVLFEAHLSVLDIARREEPHVGTAAECRAIGLALCIADDMQALLTKDETSRAARWALDVAKD